MSSQKMTRMFGLRPDGAAGAGVGAAGAAFWACANALEVSVAAATNVDVPSNMFRRLRARSSAFFEGASNCSWLLASLLIALSILQMKDESHFGAGFLITHRNPTWLVDVSMASA